MFHIPQRIALTEVGTISSLLWAAARSVSAVTPILREIVRHGWFRPVAGRHGRLVKKAVEDSEPVELSRGPT
jgi:hypothetical protein